MSTRKINRKWMLAVAIPALLFASCSKDDPGMEPGGPATGGGDIKFEIGFAPQGGADQATAGYGAPHTRVATDADFKSTWEDGDEIGIFAVKRKQNETATLAASGNFIHNVKLTYSSANGGSWSGPAYWPNDGQLLEFYAYYPYDANATNPLNIAFNVAADQSGTTDDGKSNYNLSDLLTAYSPFDPNGVVYKKGSTVMLQFSHALAMVQVTLDNTEGGIDPNDIGVTLRNVQTAAGLDMLDRSDVTATGETGDVTMHRVEQPTDPDYRSSYTFRALVPTQTLPAGASICRIYNGDYIYEGEKLSAALNLIDGRAELFTQKLPFAMHKAFIKAGTFQMGSPASEPDRSNDETQHPVTLTKDFRMSRYQVTNSQYAAFLNANGIGSDGKWATGQYPNQQLISASPGSYDWGLHWNSTDNKWEPSGANSTDYSDHPVICVTWYGAMEYARWVGGSLPTEAQWEYACRGDYPNKATETDTKPFGIGNGTKLTYDMANFDTHCPYDVAQGGEYNDASGTGYKGSTTPVGFYSGYANNYGLYDMHGNVREWCLDQWDASDNYSSLPDTDPVGNSGSHRVLRGGDRDYNAMFCRSAFRNYAPPAHASISIGFRVVFVP